MNGEMTAEQRVSFKAISDGLSTYLDDSEGYNRILRDLLEASQRKEASALRVAGLIKRDAEQREADQRRKAALSDLEAGLEINPADLMLKPTPEQLRDPAFVTRKVAAKHWADGGLTGYRRLHISQITYLASRGVLDDQLFAACQWYLERYEAAEMEPTAAVAQYGETVRGDPLYGPLPRTEWAAEARADFRAARCLISADLLPTFEMVVLKDITLSEVARLRICNFRNVRAAFLQACHQLYEGVQPRLQKIIDKK